MTTLTALPRSAPARELPVFPGVRPEALQPASREGEQTTWLRPRYSLSAHGEGLAVKVEAASAPC